MYKSRASRELIAASEETLTDCLYHNPVTLADVEALIPALSRNYKLLNRLSTNIGLYHARRHIPPPALESMLTHIFTHDDYKYSLFPRTTAQIERFEHEHAEYQLRLLTPLQRKSKQKDEAFQRRKAAAKVHRAADHIRMSIPPRYGTKSAHSFLPDGCSSIANIITEVDGMKWTQALHVIRAPWYMLMLNRAPIQCC
ncbi:hypothetical protein CC86DRAFT_373315 [Ophiobolus disseminans]|uniref:Uncharacterized protein n=1 Tax=Ophiobolus disseminans TaxID=1469910 RepID=A0A6A6ZPB4_9PLEO|nr:hypothetical protein CC86DRAFT_373315 [Ophiobolus disseminans]